ncbi:MAG: iron-containing alcohol dehydrogenase [Ruminococcaceae bacterium]|nr:iron-containing alcohol dehydrogenase [Oscillospiraceae bacterium]
MSTEFLMPGRVITGQGAVRSAAAQIAACGKRALIVTDPVIRNLPAFRELTAVLDEIGVAYAVFSDVTGEPTDRMIDAGLAAYRGADCDFLIAIGGGSPMDSMKAIAALTACGGRLRDYMGKEIAGDFPKMIAIPTTAGTGSEATRFTIITDVETNVKMLLKGEQLIPDMAIIDPAYSMGVPPAVTAATGLDALTHAVESYTSKKAQPLTDAMALSAVRRVFRSLPAAFSDGSNAAAREDMAIAAFEAGVAINNASVTIVHGMSRPIGALFHVAHGLSNAMLLSPCIAFAKSGALARFADLGRVIGVATAADRDEDAADRFIEALAEICRTCKVPGVVEYGIDADAFRAAIPKMTHDALASGSPANTQREVTAEDIAALYESLL